ncbi:hypothetical protein BX666DRAFT_1894720 [Dichotomocladium elegans]|nr:hypothetical protein BX666DRAFT_1894720 [Dichotomocladium elegans]
MQHYESALPPRAQWELAFIYAFVTVFGGFDRQGIHAFPDLQPEDLERSLNGENNPLLNDLLTSFLSNTLNRKKRLDIKQCHKELLKLINSKMSLMEADLQTNPLQNNSFEQLEPTTKLTLLRYMVEWQLQDSNIIRSIVDTSKGTSEPSIRSMPVGTDSKKRAYWHFGDAPWLWREKSKLRSGCQWETVSRTIEELQHFAESLAKDIRSERELAEYITQEIIPLAEEAVRRKQRKERERDRQVLAEQLITERRLRPRRGVRPARYNFDDMYKDEDFADRSDDYICESPAAVEQSTPPTRSSNRLNPRPSSLPMYIDEHWTIPTTSAKDVRPIAE